MVSPDQVIECDGLLSEWRYQAKVSAPFRAIVWRKADDAPANTNFRIVGINDIPAGAVNTEVTYQVPAEKRIAVEAGDMIGWSFGQGVLTYNHNGGILVRWVGGHLHSTLEPDQLQNINGALGNREYSIKARVEAKEIDEPKGLCYYQIRVIHSCLLRGAGKYLFRSYNIKSPPRNASL